MAHDYRVPACFNKLEAAVLNARADFNTVLQPWDGFGLNYVETCQTRDYAAHPQDYGGMSIISDNDQARLIDLAFGPDGLRPGVVKMFLDPYHQPQPPAAAHDDYTIDHRAYDHATTTRWMQRFVSHGLHAMRAQGLSFDVIVTLYGPPAWMTMQRFVRGRDLDLRWRVALAKYIAAWAQHLRDCEDIPVRFVSLHNEGEDWARWPLDGSTADQPGHDYNMYWPAELVAEMVPLLRAVLDANGMRDVGVTPGETSNWLRFHQWGYADALADDPAALNALGLITSHGFESGFWKQPGLVQRWCGDWRSTGVDALRAARPELHSWVTSTSWSKMNAGFVWELMQNVYAAKNNAIIPWACIQRSRLWTGGDPNPGTAFRVHEDGTLCVESGYYYFKQACMAGRPGMHVCRAHVNSTRCGVMAFAPGVTAFPPAAVLINAGDTARSISVRFTGGAAAYHAWRTSPDEQCAPLGVVRCPGRVFDYLAPADSVTTFVAAE